MNVTSIQNHIYENTLSMTIKGHVIIYMRAERLVHRPIWRVGTGVNVDLKNCRQDLLGCIKFKLGNHRN